MQDVSSFLGAKKQETDLGFLLLALFGSSYGTLRHDLGAENRAYGMHIHRHIIICIAAIFMALLLSHVTYLFDMFHMILLH